MYQHYTMMIRWMQTSLVGFMLGQSIKETYSTCRLIDIHIRFFLSQQMLTIFLAYQNLNDALD